jgi:hypothetical protein
MASFAEDTECSLIRFGHHSPGGHVLGQMRTATLDHNPANCEYRHSKPHRPEARLRGSNVDHLEKRVQRIGGLKRRAAGQEPVEDRIYQN